MQTIKICKNCNKQFNQTVILNDRGKYVWCPHCHSKYAVIQLNNNAGEKLLMIEIDAPDSPYLN